MTAATLGRRIAALEHAAEPAGRVRVFRLPRDMTDAEAKAWCAQYHPDVAPADTVVLLRWVLPGERPAHRVGEVMP